MKKLISCKSTTELAKKVAEYKALGYTRIESNSFNLVYSNGIDEVALISNETDNII